MKYALMNLLADAAATTAPTDAAAATETMSTGATIIYYAVQFVPMILIFVVFYFLLIRPQRKKDKEAKAMLDNLKVGDRIWHHRRYLWHHRPHQGRRADHRGRRAEDPDGVRPLGRAQRGAALRDQRFRAAHLISLISKAALS